MNRKHWLILLGALLALALVVAAIFLLRPSAPLHPSPSASPPLRIPSPSPLVPTEPPAVDWPGLAQPVNYVDCGYAPPCSGISPVSRSLKLVDSDCNPIASARVNLRKENGGYVTYARTGADGIASFEVAPQAWMKLEVNYHGARYSTPVTEVSEDTQLEVQTVSLTVHLTAQGGDLADQRVDLLKSNEAYVTYTRTGGDGSASFEVLPGAEHKLRSTYEGATWVSDGIIGPAEIEHDF